MNDSATVYVIDDDELVRTSVCALARSMGLGGQGFPSAEQFLTCSNYQHPACAVVDVRMLGMSGLELQDKLRELHVDLPLIIVTAYATTALTVRAIQNGAITMLEKPFEENELWQAIRDALAQDLETQAERKRQADLRHRFGGLTATQRRVMELIVAGKQNKQIAKELDLGVRTVESRRREVFEHMKAESLPELVRIAIEADLES